MKKTLYILIGIISMIVGISGVSAEEVNIKYDQGSCTLLDDDSINYICKYKCISGQIHDVNGGNKEDSSWYKHSDDVTYKNHEQDLYIKIYFSNKENKLKYSLYTSELFNYLEVNPNIYNIDINPYGVNAWILNDYFKCHEDILTNLEYSADYFGYNWETGNSNYYWNLTIKDIFVDDEKPVVNNECGMLGSKDGELVKILKQIYMYIKIIIPVLIIGFGIADLLKSLGTGKDDDLKKAINKFAKRIILTIVFILVPIIISILINISGITSQYDKINDGIKSLFCIIE